MAMSFATITAGTEGILVPGTDFGARLEISFTPQTEHQTVTKAADGYTNVGAITAEVGLDGQFEDNPQIPLGLDQGVVVWRVTARAIDKIPGMPKAWTYGEYQITASGTLSALIDVDVTTITPEDRINIGAAAATATSKATEASGYAAAALDSAADAATDADQAAVSEANAASSASSASTSAATATTKASQASTSATTATTKAAEASTSAATATTKASEASTSATAAQGYASSAAGSVSLVAWAPSTAYAAGDVRQAPDGTAISRLGNGTSRASFDATEEAAWTSVLAKSGTLAQRDLSATIATATRPTNAVNPITGWYHVTQYGAVGNGSTSDTSAITAAIAAIPAGGGTIYFPRGTYACANLTLNKDNLTLLFQAGARLKKNANGPVMSWGSGGYTKLDCQGLRIDGEGATYAGAGLVINGGTLPRLFGGEIINTASNPIQFVGDGAGHSSRISDMSLYPIDSQVGGANENVGAILLPLDAVQAPNRHFANIHSATALLFDDAGSQDSNWVNCTGRNLLNSGTPAKQYLVSCRFASAAAAITLRGTQSMWVGCAFAGSVTVHGSSSNSTLAGCVGAGDLTIASGAQGTSLAANTIVGVFYDYGTRTRIAGGGMDGTYLPPHTVDPRGLSAASTLNANQAVFLRARGRGYISKIGLHVGTSSGNICVGVYSNNASTGNAARPNTRKATSGSVACPASGYAEVSLTAPVYVEEGDWLAIVADNATATFYRASAGAFGSNLANGVSHHQSSAFPLPSTCSPGTGTLFSVLLTGVI